tara:strand:+ start:310 stop:573 length:264 start_codon:yes stop_codon:yes gene_type:complete
MEDNPQALDAILNAVQQQLESPESPYVREHYDRLIASGEEHDKVMQMLGSVLAIEMWEMSTLKRDFDESTYISRLTELPQQSWQNED